MADTLTVLRAGLATVTDLGRSGLSRSGIPVGGAADQYSATVANVLVGNAPHDPLIEVTATGFSFTASRDLLISVTGAPAKLTVAGRPCPTWGPVGIAADEPVTIDGIHQGLRVYLAVHGQLNAPRILGSCAPDSLLQVGTRLTPGVHIAVDSDYHHRDHPIFGIPLFRLDVPRFRFGDPWTVEVTDGPDLPDFPDADETLLSHDYTVSPDSDHIGLRLAGPMPRRTSTTELLSRGVPVGTVEVPPSDALLVLQRGRPVTAGYPVIAVATRTAQAALGQARPGDIIRFRLTTVDAAVASHRRWELAVHGLDQRVRTVFDRLGISHHTTRTDTTDTDTTERNAR
ncbi:5-oxoprolinase subunit C family protein [Streptomyces malaysiensis]|uniref:5-oxoprolinase subunit C family protein n=1 Tax=Streptomyces malaysiensis TaxID=92644 RepID=UPI002B2FDAEF|nr:biotin-dependent carboxyltransferase family protein [Streptomyces malaysiensis]